MTLRIEEKKVKISIARQKFNDIMKYTNIIRAIKESKKYLCSKIMLKD